MQYLHFFIIFIIAVSVTSTSFVYATQHERLIEFKNIGGYIAFENKMKTDLKMPIIPVNYETGKLEPTKQHTTDYTVPIFHGNKSDVRIISFIDQHADIRGQTVIDKDAAKQKGWIFDFEDDIR